MCTVRLSVFLCVVPMQANILQNIFDDVGRLYILAACCKFLNIIKYPAWIYDLHNTQQKTIQG